MKITTFEIILIILILVVLVIGVDHLLLRQRYDFMKWQYEATGIINGHEKILMDISKRLQVPITPSITEKDKEMIPKRKVE